MDWKAIRLYGQEGGDVFTCFQCCIIDVVDDSMNQKERCKRSTFTPSTRICVADYRDVSVIKLNSMNAINSQETNASARD